MSETVEDLGGASGGSVFVAKFVSPTVKLAYNTPGGTVATITPPPGQRVMLAAIGSGGVDLTNLMSVLFGGNAVISDVKITQASTDSIVDNELCIGYKSKNQMPVIGGIDEVMEITSNVALAQAVVYAYQFGVLE